MKMLKIGLLLIVNMALFAQKQQYDNYNDLKLWYETPAKYFEEALPLGNGKMGAMVFGGTNQEKIYLNDITLWSGIPVDPYMNKNAYQYIPEIRAAIQNHLFPLADSLIKNIQGKFSESYAPLGTLLIDYPSDSITHYYRDLNLNKATASVTYLNQGNAISKEFFEIAFPWFR